MEIKKIQLIILLGFCAPYAYLSMYWDMTYGTMVLYCVMAAALGLLCWSSIRINSLRTLIVGNILSFAVTCLCILRFHTEEWSWYFKPLTALQLAAVLSVLATAAQYSAWVIAKKNRKPHT